MSADIIKEFLVGLGFKVDAPGLKRFTQGIESATKVAVKAGAAATAMGLAVEAAVVKVSKQFEDLYYASQRINSSVENIRAMDYAVSQMGGSAQGARAAMEGVASLIRSNPGGENFIRSLGVETREANGAMRDTAEILKDLGDRFRNMPYYAAKVRAGVLGIDEATLQALIRGTDEFADSYSEAARRIGVDHEAAAKASHDFMVAVRSLKMQLELLIAKLLLTLQNSKMLERLVANLTPVFEFLGRIVGRLAEWFGKADDATGGWSTALLVLFGVLAPIVAIIGPVVAGVIALVVAIGALIDDFQTWREGGKSLIDWEVWVGEISRVLEALKPFVRWLGILLGWIVDLGAAILKWMGPYVGNVAHAFLESLAGGLNVVAGMIRTIVALLRGDWAAAFASAKQTGTAWLEGWGNVWDKLTGGRDRGDPPPPAAATASAAGATGAPAPRRSGRAPLGVRNNNPGNLRRWGKVPTRGGFAVFDTPEQGLSAMAGNLLAYGRRGDDSVSEIIRKWAPPSENNTGAYVAAVAKALGVDPNQRLNLKDAGTLSKLMQAISRHENGGEYYNDALYRAAANARLGMPTAQLGVGRGASGGVSITQKTDIHVNGSGDPNAAGRAVANEQGRVNGDLVRNTRGAVR